jgi:hypothetical protein
VSSSPFERIPDVARFTVTSSDVNDGQPFAAAQMSGAFGVPGGEDSSPQLSWSVWSDSGRGLRRVGVDDRSPDARRNWLIRRPMRTGWRSLCSAVCQQAIDGIGSAADALSSMPSKCAKADEETSCGEVADVGKCGLRGRPDCQLAAIA